MQPVTDETPSSPEEALYDLALRTLQTALRSGDEDRFDMAERALRLCIGYQGQLLLPVISTTPQEIPA